MRLATIKSVYTWYLYSKINSTICRPCGYFTKAAMAISVQEKVYSSTHCLRYMANNLAIFYNSNSEIIMACSFPALASRKELLQQQRSIPGNNRDSHERKKSIEVYSAPSDEFTGHKVRKNDTSLQLAKSASTYSLRSIYGSTKYYNNYL